MGKKWIILSTPVLIIAAIFFFNTGNTDMPKDVKEAYAAIDGPLDYNLDVKPILADKCFACHGPDKAKQKAGLRLDHAEFAYAALSYDKGKVAIDPGHPDNSEAFYRIISADPGYMMPTPESHLKLTPAEKAILIKWIKEGAVYKPHWAFVAPQKSAPPRPQDDHAIIKNPIDNFILARLERKKLKPSGPADKAILLRRLSLDLTGLPPTISETDAFLKDSSSNAYEKQVDRLMTSPHYGEKMAVDWLDVARFADSHGYTVDRLRDMSPYRDWVIKAFNNNMPYDKFLQWQLAGDLMPNPTQEMLIATAFNRNHQQNMEGGIIEEEFQAEYVVDRTNTFGNAMLGLSVGCAKCHDHKYDPISQKNYYELFSFFNNVREAGQISFDDALPTPTLMLPTEQKQKILGFINNQINDEEKEVAHAAEKASAGFDSWINSGKYFSLATETLPQQGLQAYFNFNRNNLVASNDARLKGQMLRETYTGGDQPGFKQHALLLNGDDWLDLGAVGRFKKAEPFSIGIRVNVPAGLKDGVIFHKCVSDRLYDFRGYYLRLLNNQLELSMAHTAPSNAITKLALKPLPRDSWVQLTVTYDGSSKAHGLKLYMDGEEVKTEVVIDQLTKEITFPDASKLIGNKDPGLQVGAWWRGSGLKDALADDITVYDRTLSPVEVQVLAGKTSWAAVIQKGKPSDENKNLLKEYYLSAVDPDMMKQQDRLAALRQTLADSTENVEELMVMQEMPTPKKSFLLKRGNYDMPGEQVFPATPASILPYDDHLPKNRYGLALWLTDKRNPLAARVAVNRLWQSFFGTGIVKTSEDFGNQGELPSHPELLDWLAVTFMETGWDLRKLNKLIVMSATYQQDSKASAEAREKDPENRLLSHGPAYRMTAEMIRDNALFASGLMNMQIGGKSVKPYQPSGLWEINNTTYTPDTGAAVYRRSLYVLIKRSVPNPTLATFDASSRSYCIMRRQNTNTPLQALVTLNDPTFVEASKVMGEEMTRVGDSQKAITEIYRKLTGHFPQRSEVSLLLDLHQTELKKFKEHPEKQKGWLSTGQYTIDKRLDSAELAANSVVANTILNSDASLTKR